MSGGGQPRGASALARERGEQNDANQWPCQVSVNRCEQCSKPKVGGYVERRAHVSDRRSEKRAREKRRVLWWAQNTEKSGRNNLLYCNSRIHYVVWIRDKYKLWVTRYLQYNNLPHSRRQESLPSRVKTKELETENPKEIQTNPKTGSNIIPCIQTHQNYPRPPSHRSSDSKNTDYPESTDYRSRHCLSSSGSCPL